MILKFIWFVILFLSAVILIVLTGLALAALFAVADKDEEENHSTQNETNNINNN